MKLWHPHTQSPQESYFITAVIAMLAEPFTGEENEIFIHPNKLGLWRKDHWVWESSLEPIETPEFWWAYEHDLLEPLIKGLMNGSINRQLNKE